MNSPTKRIFLAIEVSTEWKAAINQFIEANKKLNYRWIPEQNWHFTLLFIGDFPAETLNSIYTLLEKCFADFPVFEIDFEAFTYFPTNKPKLIWEKGKPNRSFENLESLAYKTLKHFCREQDMEFNAKPSKKSIPHITLSRLKNLTKPLTDLQNPELKLPSFKIKEIVLFESELKANGAKYTNLARFDLKIS